MFDQVSKIAKRAAVESHALATVARAGMLGVAPPGKMAGMLHGLTAFGPVGGAITLAAIKHPDRPGLVDELGTLTFRELDQRSNALANVWRDRGIAEGAGVGILCRNHRGMLDATFASAKVGARALYLNTDFARPQATDVCAREGVDVLVYDEEFTEVLADVAAPKGRFLAWTDNRPAVETLDDLIAKGAPELSRDPGRPGGLVLLTSGTTGTPKGAPRPQPKSLAIPGAILSKIPFRGGETMYVAPPIFHTWGLTTSILALGVGATLVTRRRFRPEEILGDLARHKVASFVVVPVMLKRILALGEPEIAKHDLSSVRVIAAAGSQLEGALAVKTMDIFGDVLYNLYGSTEAAYASIADPADLRAAPGCAGRPPFGSTVKILGDDGGELPQGQTGRIFVGNTSQFDGYTGGGHKEVIRGLMSTGDVGHFDAGGRLFVDGRDDDMIVSGGENVFPQEVEELLAGHDSVNDAAVVGVDDEEFGKALRAFVVRRAGSELDEDAVREFVKQNLARYKVPRKVVFLDELPRNPSGKVLKRLLATWDS
ncbi:MAG: AMP-binding protein [Micromonosporaceae bacterium]|nr:AMP-binding protein [Micromonosporaceae bacterium]